MIFIISTLFKNVECGKILFDKIYFFVFYKIKILLFDYVIKGLLINLSLNLKNKLKRPILKIKNFYK